MALEHFTLIGDIDPIPIQKKEYPTSTLFDKVQWSEVMSNNVYIIFWLYHI